MRIGRRSVLVLGLWLALFAGGSAFTLHAQETPQQQSETRENESGDKDAKWKLVNTAIFAALLGWFLYKNAPRFFNARSLDIQKAIKDATGLKIEADFRYSEADRRMAGLPGEVEKLRAEAVQERNQEHNRIRRETEAEVTRIQASADAEVEALRREASSRVQLHTAQLALGLAEKRLLDRFAQSEPPGVIDDFIRLIERSKN